MSPNLMRGLLAFLVVLGAVILTILRRPDQFSHPALFVEEGSQFILQFLDKGWLYIFEPVNGYMIVPSKLISLAAIHTSFLHLPTATISYTLGVLAIVAVIIALSPTTIPFRPIAALVPFLIPIEAEPYGIGGYAFWFVGLLSILALLWRAEVNPLGRYACAFVGALASPLAILVMPLMVVRAAATRKRTDIVAAVVALVPVIWQLYLIQKNSAASPSQIHFTPDYLATLFEKFIADFFWNADSWMPLAFAAAATILVAFLVAVSTRKRDWTPLALLACFGAAVVASVARVPIESIDSIQQAPRYFFYPYILLAWLLLSLISGPILKKVGVAAMLVVPLAFLFNPHFVRHHETLDWASAASACVGDKAPFEQNVIQSVDGWGRLSGRMELSGQFLSGGINAAVSSIDEPIAGSGRDSDAAVGSGSFVFDQPQTAGWIAVHIVAGPDATDQTLRVLGAEKVYPLSALRSQLNSWGYVVVPAAGATGIALADEGTGWGQWSAIADLWWAPVSAEASVHSLPVHYDGSLTNRWKVDLTHEQCRTLSGKAIFG